MAIFIEKIKLTNWFNFKGDPDEKTGRNTIVFNEGLNIIIGDNNGGKTKLHNALRYILSDLVILDLNNKVELYPAEGNELEILNKDTFLHLPKNQIVRFGVELEFRKTRRNGESKKYILEKYIEGRKEATSSGKDKFHCTTSISKAYDVDPITKSLLERVGEYEKVRNQLLSPAYMNFFLVEGEQIGLITTMQGSNLQKTINVINPTLHQYNKTFETVSSVKDSIKRLENAEDKRITEGNEEKTNLSKEKTKLTEITIPNIEEKIKILDESNKEWEATIEEYEQKARQSEAKIAQIVKYNTLKEKVKVLERDKENIEVNYINSLIKRGFNISKLSDDILSVRTMDQVSLLMKDNITIRKGELDLSSNEKEIMMLQSLDKSQPNPTILRKMIDDCRCYVCQNEIDSNSKNWIEKKLIPFFEEKDIDDRILKNLNNLKELFSVLNSMNDRKKSLNKSSISELKKELIEINRQIKKASDTVKEFIDSHGEVSEKEEDAVNIQTYHKAQNNKIQNRTDHGIEVNELKVNKNRVKELTKLIQGDAAKNPKLERIQNLNKLLKDLDEMFAIKKQEIFEGFAKKLEVSSTLRFKKFLSRNDVAKHQEISVNLIEKSKDFEFQINVKNKFGTIQSQAGGAQDSLTKLSVVFALLDISKERNSLGYPFMADAPSSKLSKPQKESFYEQLSSDDALNQTLLMTMDLFDSKENNDKNLNDLGLKVLNSLSKHQDSSMIFLGVIDNKKPEIGVEVKYLKK